MSRKRNAVIGAFLLATSGVAASCSDDDTAQAAQTPTTIHKTGTTTPKSTTTTSTTTSTTIEVPTTVNGVPATAIVPAPRTIETTIPTPATTLPSDPYAVATTLPIAVPTYDTTIAMPAHAMCASGEHYATVEFDGMDVTTLYVSPGFSSISADAPEYIRTALQSAINAGGYVDLDGNSFSPFTLGYADGSSVSVGRGADGTVTLSRDGESTSFQVLGDAGIAVGVSSSGSFSTLDNATQAWTPIGRPSNRVESRASRAAREVAGVKTVSCEATVGPFGIGE